MRERAFVVKTAGKTAVLQIEKSPACEGCRICAFKAGKSRVKVKARNSAGAKKGDTVIVQAEKDNRTLASFIVYIVPVLLAGVGALVGALCALAELYIALLCLAGLALGFAAVFCIDKLLARSRGFGMEVVEICPVQPEGAAGAEEEGTEEKTDLSAVSERDGGAHTIECEEENKDGKDV